MKTLMIRGNAFHTPTLGNVEVLQDYLFLINEDGVLTDVVSPTNDNYEEFYETHRNHADYIHLKDSQFLLPGFIDTHVHAPQWPQAGKALHVDLPTWLNTYTFPLENSYQDEAFAQTVYADLIDTLLANGTTTSLYFGSIHLEPNRILAQLCADKGQRAFIGNVVMDDISQSPDFYSNSSPEQAVATTESFLSFTQHLSKTTPQGIYGVVTPRFIPTCSDEVLANLGKLASTYDAPIQSHCSEGDWEHAYVQERTGKRDTQALYDFGLLTNKTVMAHCVFLNDEDALLFKQSGASIAHCPVSNVLFANAIAPIRHRLEQGVNVGLATDISGGYSPSMFDAMRQAILSSRTLEDGVHHTLAPEKRGCPNSRFDFRHALYMATVGGATALSLQTGLFKPGYSFDALLIDTQAPDSNLRTYDFDTPEDILQKTIFLGQRTNIVSTWVQGRSVYKRKNN